VFVNDQMHGVRKNTETFIKKGLTQSNNVDVKRLDYERRSMC